MWEYYAGQGIEIQWLGTFGEANGYYLSGKENASLRQLLNEVIPLATQRAGGIAWEYMFHFDGGSPPWTSGLSQGTALQVLSRASSRFKEQAYLSAAQQALGIFQTPPPAGVRVQTAAGAEYAEYTYAPSDMILNGFIQAVVGLYEYTSITHDPLGLRLFEEGDAEARAEVPGYNTGAWSMYDQYGESNLNYHELLTEFLQHLCETHAQGHRHWPAAPSPAPSPTPAPSSPPGASTSSGGAQRGERDRAREDARPASAQTPIPGDRDLLHDRSSIHRRPAHAAGRLAAHDHASKAARGRACRCRCRRSRPCTSRSGEARAPCGATARRCERGKPKLLWITPSQTGSYSVTRHGDRPGRQLRDGDRHDHADQALSRWHRRLD